MRSSVSILFILPVNQVSPQPVIDRLTKAMTAALRKSTPGTPSQGFHECTCGAHSDNADHFLPDGRKTNSLSVHYLAYHRAEVPAKELELVEALQYGEAEPNELELASPYQDPADGRAVRTRRVVRC